MVINNCSSVLQAICEQTFKNSVLQSEEILEVEYELQPNLEKLLIKFKNRRFRFRFCGCTVTYQKNIVINNTTSSNTFYPKDFPCILKFDVNHVRINLYSLSPRRFSVLIQLADETGNNYSSQYYFDLPLLVNQKVWIRSPKLDLFMPSPSLRTICQQHFNLNMKNTEEEMQLCIDFEMFRRIKPKMKYQLVYRYVDMQSLMINIEDVFAQMELKEYSMINARFHQEHAREFSMQMNMKVPDKKLKQTEVCLTTMDLYKRNHKNLSKVKRAFIQVVKASNQTVILENGRDINLAERYHVEFRPNRYSFRVCQQSLERLKKLKLEKFFETFKEKYLTNQKQIPQNIPVNVQKLEWVDSKIGSNPEQMSAVRNILSCTAFPMPYVILGPPGTGKTSTLVEAVNQIVKLKPNSRILITSQSNSACDEIGVRLLRCVSVNKIYRLYAPSCEKNPHKMNKKLKPISNIKDNQHKFPSYQEIYSKNIVISTLVNCYHMLKMKEEYFDYIFIDECAACMEATALIPISNFGAKDGCITTNIVLLGDPKQLGPILNAIYSEKLGLDMSLMERIMYHSPYIGNEPKYVMQLVQNFRSHPAILAFSNREFYGGKLVPKLCHVEANFAIGWKKLPNKKFPLIFHSVLGASELAETSHFNEREVDVVDYYVQALLKNGINGKKVLPSDIAIISPYRAQQTKLEEKFQHLSGIEIGTVDYYQGREKKIIILTAVRSQTETVGFLKNEKRLNVALTRPKVLLVVVGNPETLSKSEIWKRFIEYCMDNKAVVGETRN